MDKEDATSIITENRSEFKSMYKDVLTQSPFKDTLKFEEGIMSKQDDRNARQSLMMQLNDNVFQNIEGMNF